MNIEHLITFQRLARERSFSGTAASLGVSQPTVTMRIKEIEHHTGKLLVQRIGQHILLTEAGELFLNYANRIILVLEAGKENAKERQTHQTHIRLASTSTICCYFIPLFLRYWYDIHPLSRVTTLSHRTKNILHMIQDGIIQVGLVRGESFPQPYASFTLYDDPICLVVPPSHRLATDSTAPNNRISIFDFEKEPIIIYRSESWNAVSNVFINHGLFPNIIAELSHVNGVKKMVETGAGIAFLPYSTVSSELGTRRLAALNIKEIASISLPTQAVFLSSSAIIENNIFSCFLTSLKTFSSSFLKKKEE